MVVEVAADHRRTRHQGDADTTKVVRIAHSRTLEDRRSAVHPRCQHDEVTGDGGRLAVADHVHGQTVTTDSDPVDDRPIEDREMRRTAHGIEVREAGVPSHAIDNVDRLEPEAGPCVEVAQIAGDEPAGGTGGLETPGVKRPRFAGGVGTDPHHLERGGEERPELIGGPAPQVPGVVVIAVADGCDRPVVSRAAAEHAGAFERPPLARVVSPVVCCGEGGGVEQFGGPASCVEWSVVGTGLDEHDVGTRRRQPGRDHGARRSRADHHDIGAQDRHVRDGTRLHRNSPRAVGLRRGCR